jgi:hypothetical protein
MPKGAVIFFPERERLNMVLNRRLPELPLAMFCLSFASEVIDPRNRPADADLTRVETFPGAACLTRLAVMQRAKTNIEGSFLCDPKRLPSRSASPYHH